MDFPFLIGAGRFDSVLLGYPEGTISPIRKIEYYEFNLFTEKYGYGFVYDRIIPYDENVLAVWKPGGQKHSKLNFKCRYIHFSTGDQTLIDLIEGMPDYLYVSDIEKYVILFDKIAALHPTRTESEKLRFSAYLLTLISYILDEKEKTQTGETIMNKSEYKISMACSYLDKYYMNDISLSDIADSVAVTKGHLCRSFKKALGCSPHQYLLNLRINHACNLLNYEDFGIAQISDLCGFSSYNSFNVAFKKRFGISPKEYRLKKRNDN